MKRLITLMLLVATGTALAGSLDPAQKKWIDKYQKQKQKNLPAAEDMLLNTDPEPALKDGFTSLFNGKDLKGWTPVGGTCTFEVKDGCIVGTTIKGSPSTYLCTDKMDYTDFIFTCEMKWNVDGNSGVMFRSQMKENKKGKTAVGPQMEMEGAGDARDWSGGIYGQGCGGWYYPLWLAEHKAARAALDPNEWSRLVIQAKGNVVKTWINGVPVAHWVNDKYKSGCFGLQVHSGSKGEVLWRNIKVKELK